MVSTSKILTVSYGTFSCTLEGFDESFDTMKAIAEYFRDLAADDRYFGAEPPTPDADMLARIAEREIERRVEARDQDGRIHLRAAALADKTADNVKATEPVAETVNQPVAQPVPVTPPETTEVSAAALPAGGTAATTTEVAAESSAMPPARDMAELSPDSSPDSNDALDQAEQDDTTPGDDFVDEGDAFLQAETVQTDAPATAPATAPPTAKDDASSVADKLRRIRAVASPETSSFSATAYNEDEHAQDFLSDTAAELDEVLAQDDAVEEAATTSEDAQPDEGTQATTSEPDLSDDDILSLLASEEVAPEQPDEDVDDVEAAEIDATSNSFEDTLAQLMADAMQDGAAQPEPQPRPTQESAPEAIEQIDAPTPEQAAPVDEHPAQAAERPLNARVIKMKRSEFEAAIEDAQIEEDTDPAAILSPDAEAELQRELAEVEAEIAETLGQTSDRLVTDSPAPAPVQQEAAPKKDNAARLAPEADDVEAARMFKEADTQLGDSEGTERRSAIKHLRAAVAATKAEKSAGGEMARETDAAPYQSDLQEVVRPRRPQASGAGRTERPAPERPAPLRLVAEQRIDTPRAPVRPRRVSLAQGDTPGAASTPTPAQPAAKPSAAPVAANSADFADYAEQVGANSLTEMLEAAAAYLSDIEGHDQFSRPMLMHKLRELDEENFSREDGLRSFGQLLRDGKLQKLKGGRFTVTPETDFRKAG